MTYSVREQDDGHWSFRARPQTYDFDPANYGPEKVTERYWAPSLLITDHIAVFSAPHDSHIDGEFSRCSTNALDLVKIDGNWKVGNSSRIVKKAGWVAHAVEPPSEARK